jgi:hypothetical protein
VRESRVEIALPDYLGKYLGHHALLYHPMKEKRGFRPLLAARKNCHFAPQDRTTELLSKNC